MNKEILDYLKSHPQFRERSSKNKWVGGIVLKKYGVELTPKMKDQLGDIVGDILGADRMWRKHTAENPDLRGSDYGDKQVLEEEAQLALGYEPGFATNAAFS